MAQVWCIHLCFIYKSKNKWDVPINLLINMEAANHQMLFDVYRMECYHLNSQLGSRGFSQTDVIGDQRKLPDKTKSLWSSRIWSRWSFCKINWSIVVLRKLPKRARILLFYTSGKCAYILARFQRFLSAIYPSLWILGSGEISTNKDILDKVEKRWFVEFKCLFLLTV